MIHDPAMRMLMDEHAVILRVIGSLERLADSLAHGDTADAGLLREAVRFMREFADRRHHGKEEDLLFPAMEGNGVPAEGGPLGVMTEEHVTARRYVAALERAAEAYAAGGADAATTLVAALRDVCALYPEHIWKEDNVLYPMATDSLSPQALNELLQKFEAVEAEFGDESRRTYVAFADRLARAYPED